MRNMRKHQRALTLSTASIVSETIESVISCAILNISDAGACILVPDPAAIPEMFGLMVDSTGVKYTCRVQWRAGKRIGVSFQPHTNNIIEWANVCVF